MKRSMMSVMVIFMTFISVFIMLYSDGSIAVSMKEEIQVKELEKSEKKDTFVDSVAPTSTIKKLNSVVVFRIPREEIKDSLSAEERAILLSLKRKISPVDCLKIEDYFKYEDSEAAVVNSITLLKTRLSKSDYQKFRDIANKYIYIDRIEKVI